MAIVTNNTETLLHTPSAPECGMPAQCWIPGKNPLDPTYWAEVKDNFMLKKFLKVKIKGRPMIEVDLKANMPDPLKPPKLEDLLDHAETFEVQEILDDRSTPETWKPVLKQALHGLAAKQTQDKADRDAIRLKARMSKGAPTAEKGLTGMPVRLALPKVEAETDVDTLVGWYDADDRTTVRKAIDKRMGELEEPEDPEAPSETETATEEPSEPGED